VDLIDQEKINLAYIIILSAKTAGSDLDSWIIAVGGLYMG